MKHLNETLVTAAKRAKLVFDNEDWAWTHTEGTPTVLDIYVVLADLLEGVEGDPDARCHGTGRLKVERVRDEEGNTESIEIFLQLGYIDVKWAPYG